MLACCETDRDRMLIKLLWHTGARVSEAIAVRVGDITKNGLRMKNLKQGFWRKLPDGGKRHIAVPTEKHVFCSPEYLDELRSYASGLPPEASLIGRLADGRQLSRKMAWVIVTRTAARAGILRTRFSDGILRPAWTHTLRHSAASHLLMAGAPITLVQHQLGHSSLSSTQVYTQLADPEISKFIAKVPF